MYQQFLPELEERFLRYVQIYTASEENSPTAPSTPRQVELLNLLVDELPSNVAPAWSYDGTQIVYLSSRRADEDTGPWQLWVMNADGSGQTRLTNHGE